MRHGYECRKCGSIPSEEELQRGTCTSCAEDERYTRPLEMNKINNLPVGGTIDIVKADIINHSDNSLWFDRVLARFRCTRVRRDGSREYTFVIDVLDVPARNCHGKESTIKIRTGTLNRKMKEGESWWTAKGIYNTYLCERTYGASLRILDNVPSQKELTRERFLQTA